MCASRGRRRGHLLLRFAAHLLSLGVLLALTTLACTNKDVSFDSGPDALPDEVVLGDEVVCANPVSGFNRFEEQGAQRGLDLDLTPYDEVGGCNYIPSALVAQDLDNDGDPDLAFNNPNGFPYLYENDGGQFTQRVVNWSLPDASRISMAFSAVDLNGDSLPDILLVAENLLLVSWNTGDFGFTDFQVLYDEPAYPRICLASMAVGDVDSDGDLDIALPGLDEVLEAGFVAPGSGDWLPTPDRLFINQGHNTFEPWGIYSPADGFSLTVAFTDRDNDGDLDLFAGTDRPFDQYPPMAFLTNTGNTSQGPILTDEAPELEADIRVSAMGLGVHDMNGDGLYDYCMTDISFDLTCLMSVPGQAYYEAGASLGLTVDLTMHPDVPDDYEQKLNQGNFVGTAWASWGLAVIDLDNDANLDVVATAGPPPDYGSPYTSDLHGFQPEWIWQGTPSGGFETRILETGYHSTNWNYSIVTADFDGDGYRDWVLGPSEGRPAFRSNPCGEGNWLEVELLGIGDNAEAFGARVEFTAGGVTQVQEMHNLLAVGQSISRLHFGLGDVEEGTLKVRFPDRTVVEAKVPVNRLVTVSHPER